MLAKLRSRTSSGAGSILTLHARASEKDCKDLVLRLSTGGSGKRPSLFFHYYRVHATKFYSFLDIDNFPETQVFFGSDSTTSRIRYQFSTSFHQDVKAPKNTRARGFDCKDITLPSLAGLQFSAQHICLLPTPDTLEILLTRSRYQQILR
jgi:hypothetical protein